MWNSTILTEAVKKVSAAHAFWFMILCVTFTGLYFLISPITQAAREWVDCANAKKQVALSKEQLDLEVENKLRFERALDSVKKANAAKEAITAERNRKEILSLFIRTKYTMPNVESVSYWSMHNGGDNLDVESRRYLEVFISSDDEIENRWSKPKPIPSGVHWLTQESINKPYFLVNSVSAEHRLYKGQTKMLLNRRGVKSVIVLFIKNVGTDFYFISIDFDKENPLDYIPNLLNKALDLRDFVERKSNIKRL